MYTCKPLYIGSPVFIRVLYKRAWLVRSIDLLQARCSRAVYIKSVY